MNANDIKKPFDEVTAEDIKIVLAVDKWRETYQELPVIIIDNKEYAVAEGEEVANKAARRAVEDSICYSRPDFLASHSDVPEEVFVFLANKCFDNNEAYKAMIYDVDDFIDDVIDADGRGHSLSSYDGEEYEIGEYFLYRIN